jgi:hypothetical protein
MNQARPTPSCKEIALTTTDPNAAPNPAKMTKEEFAVARDFAKKNNRPPTGEELAAAVKKAAVRFEPESFMGGKMRRIDPSAPEPQKVEVADRTPSSDRSAITALDKEEFAAVSHFVKMRGRAATPDEIADIRAEIAQKRYSSGRSDLKPETAKAIEPPSAPPMSPEQTEFIIARSFEKHGRAPTDAEWDEIEERRTKIVAAEAQKRGLANALPAPDPNALADASTLTSQEREAAEEFMRMRRRAPTYGELAQVIKEGNTRFQGRSTPVRREHWR